MTISAPPAGLNDYEKQEQKQQSVELLKSAQDLEKLLHKVNAHSDRLEIKHPEKNITETFTILTRKLEEEHKRSEEANEALRKLREDDEKYVLREKITDMKQLLTDLEVENTKLKFESEQLAEDVENYKKELNEAVEEAKRATKKNYELEDDKDRLKQTISDLENDNIKLKKEMIEELNEANRAKRVSVDTEIALQHISEAYENKRREAMQLTLQLEDAERIIKSFRDQFEPRY
ncbi:hypothetical protein NQ314_002452 [Rhamnusium bicolor]|uniref:Uncharacterized protein n=1 Tax=Rhamnusium bicolor TaxID=1586634 RepID=A0AAV8ZRG8_9CUCU|nr:hypothetical protein NQ314_002452 [Rhamnusium bicolor]